MKILVIPYSYPDVDKPNVTPFIKVHTIALKKLGHQVDVLHVKLLPLRNWFQKDTLHHVTDTNEAITIFSIYMRYIHGFNPINTLFFKLKAKKLYKEYYKKNGAPDLILSHFYRYSGCAAEYIARKYSIPFLHIEHAGWLLNNMLNQYEIICLKRVAHKAQHFICVSPELQEAVEKKTGFLPNLSVIPNMINDVYHYYEKEKKELFTFFSAGNLYEGKRFPLLIRSFCEAFSQNDNVELRIAGDGHLRPIIEKQISDNHREEQIKLLGSLNTDSMLKEYINCDSFVLASEHETFGIVYREAISVGRPVITTNHQGFRHDWSDEYGIRIDIDNQEQLKKALLYMKNHADDYDGQVISKKCQELYSEKKVINHYQQILNKI